MGGFLMNGCGAADTVSKLRLLKTEHCPTCGKVRDFYLARIRMKIHVVFIPTIPLNTKYGIVCAKCKTGNYITEEQMKQLMNADEKSKVLLFDAIMHPGNNGDGQTDLISQKEEHTQENATGNLPSGEKETETGNVLVCSHCGKALTGNEDFCGYCGTALKELVSGNLSDKPETEEVENPVQEEVLKFCPQCGEPVPEKSYFCGQCGTALRTLPVAGVKVVSVGGEKETAAQSVQDTVIAAPVEESICANKETEMWECPLCMTKNDAGMNRCRLCGQVR